MIIMAEYVCSRGETFDSISLNIYGSDSYVQDLLKANPEMSGRLIMNGGERLRVPGVQEIPTGIIVQAPWKEGIQ